MDREQIIKALECCYDNNLSCLDCPFQAPDKYIECSSLTISALSLIKELTEESRIANGEAYAYKLHCNRLEQQVKTLSDLLDEAYDAQNSLSEENDKLVEAGFDTVDYAVDKIRQVRADTVRKMQSEIKERCIKGGIYPAFVASTIDQIAKEMLDEG